MIRRVLIALLAVTVYAQETTTPPFTPRTNPNFPAGNVITTPEDLQGTINTNTAVTTTTSTTTTSAAPGITTTAPIVTITETTDNPDLPAPTTSTPVVITTTTAISTPLPYSVLISTSTMFTTQVVPYVVSRTITETTTVDFSTTEVHTETRFETIILSWHTSFSHYTSHSTSTVTIPGSTLTNTITAVITDWAQVTSESALVLPLASYSTNTFTDTFYSTGTNYVPSETTIAWYEPSTIFTLNLTRTTWLPTASTSTFYVPYETVYTDYSYSYSIFTGTQFATLTLSNELWVPQTSTIQLMSVITNDPLTSTNTPIYDFIYGIQTTEYSTVTNYIAETTIYSTQATVITSYITSYIQDDTKIYPYTTVTYTYTPSPSTTTSIIPPVTVTFVTTLPPVTTTTFLPGSTVTSTPQPATIISTTTSIQVSTDCANIAQASETNDARKWEAKVFGSISVALLTILLVLC